MQRGQLAVPRLRVAQAFLISGSVAPRDRRAIPGTGAEELFLWTGS